MKRTYLKTFILISALFCLSTTYAGEKVAKVIIVKGNAKAKGANNEVVDVKRGLWLQEGSVLKTSAKSFVKLLFIDKSQMNLGPKSQMKIEKFPKKEAGIINLVQGQLRSKVTKNYMGMKDKEKSKLFIKTKTAAMGVRGTDFQVNYNRENNYTSLITFEGAVAMAKLAEGVGRLQQNSLEKIVSSRDAVIVKKGQFSGSTPKQRRVTVPVKINPAQLKALEANETGAGVDEKPRAPASAKKTFRSIVPPGVDSKSVANETSEVEKQVASVAGASAVTKVEQEIKTETASVNIADTPPPEGMVNQLTGAVAPTAGGYVDMQTAIYIPPPEGSAYDPATETYIPPPSVGTFDPNTGDFYNNNYELTASGEFVAIQDPVISDSSDPTRDPASVEEGSEAPPPPPADADSLVSMDGAVVIDETGEVVVVDSETAMTESDTGSVDANTAEAIANEIVTENSMELLDSQDNPQNASTTTTLNLDFNVQ